MTTRHGMNGGHGGGNRGSRFLREEYPGEERDPLVINSAIMFGLPEDPRYRAGLRKIHVLKGGL